MKKETNCSFGVDRRTFLKQAAATSLVFTFPLLGLACEPQDETGIKKEATTAAAAAKATAAVIATTNPPTFHQQLLSMLQPGREIDIWDGTFSIPSNVNRRFEPRLRLDEIDHNYYAQPGGDKGIPFRDDVIYCPLNISGISTRRWIDWSDEGRAKYIDSPQKGFAYFSPIDGKARWVAYLVGDTDEFIRRNGVRLDYLRPVTQKEMKQKAIIQEVRWNEEDSLKRPIVIAKKTDGTIKQILKSEQSKILGIL